MEHIESNQWTDIILKKYTEEEFREVLSLLSYQKLIEPIKKRPKDFVKETKGFRVDKLSLEKVKEIYFNRIFKTKDIILSKYFNNIERIFIQEINGKIIEDENITIKDVDKLSFECIVENLIETKLKNNIDIYFKMINRKLKRKESTFLKNSLEYLIQNKEREKELKDKFNIQNDNSINELEEKYKKLISNKDNELKNLKEKVKALESSLNQEKKYSDIEIEKQIGITKSLNKSFNQKEIKLNEDIKSLNYEKQQINEKYKELYNENISYKNIIRELKEVCEKQYIEQSKIYEERWIDENYELEKVKKKIETDIEALKNKQKNIEEKIKLLDIKKNEIEESINVVKNKAGDVVDNIGKIIGELKREEFKNDTANTIIYKIEGKKNEIDSDRLISNTNDFIDDLADNLLNCGVMEECSIDLAQYIYSILASKMNLLLVGYNARKIANAISYLISNSTTEILNLPLGYNNYNELINLVNTSDAKVILIENVVDVISENIYLPLIKEKKDKHIIFSMESKENINILPDCIFNYMVIVDLDRVLSFELSEELLGGISNKNIFTVKIDESIKKKCVRGLNKLNTAIKLNNSVKLKISEIMGIVEGLNPNKAIYDTLIFSILTLCKEKGNPEELVECISNFKFEDSTYNLLKSTIEELNDNE